LLRLSPIVLFFVGTVGVGLVAAVTQSLGLSGPGRLAAASTSEGELPRFLLGYYRLFTSPGLLTSIWYSVVVAAVATVIAVSIGAVAAYALWRAPNRLRTVGNVFRIPIVMPHIVVAFVTALVWSQTGIVATIWARLGIDIGGDGFPHLIYSANGVGIVLAYVYKEFPFVMLLALGVLDRTPERIVETAHMLGAGSVRTFLKVIVPLLLPTLNQIGVILFLYALGGFDIPWLLGASRPQMIPVTVYSLYFQGDFTDRATAMAALSLLALVGALFAVAYGGIARRVAPWERVV
jgi:putative spermidine/putrescine transport system permease protein